MPIVFVSLVCAERNVLVSSPDKILYRIPVVKPLDMEVHFESSIAKSVIRLSISGTHNAPLACAADIACWLLRAALFIKPSPVWCCAVCMPLTFKHINSRQLRLSSL